MNVFQNYLNTVHTSINPIICFHKQNSLRCITKVSVHNIPKSFSIKISIKFSNKD